MTRVRALMSAVRRYVVGVGMALMVVASTTHASAQGGAGPNVVVLLRLASDSGADLEMRSCLTAKLSQMPDIKIASPSTGGVRFVVDIFAGRQAAASMVASLVVVETFPMEEFRPRFEEGEDSDALLASLQYYTLLRLHELVPGRSYQALCARIAAEIEDKVLSKEYTERND